jgi:hypothetical protein
VKEWELIVNYTEFKRDETGKSYLEERDSEIFRDPPTVRKSQEQETDVTTLNSPNTSEDARLSAEEMTLISLWNNARACSKAAVMAVLKMGQKDYESFHE